MGSKIRQFIGGKPRIFVSFTLISTSENANDWSLLITERKRLELSQLTRSIAVQFLRYSRQQLLKETSIVIVFWSSMNWETRTVKSACFNKHLFSYCKPKKDIWGNLRVKWGILVEAFWENLESGHSFSCRLVDSIKFLFTIYFVP